MVTNYGRAFSVKIDEKRRPCQRVGITQLHVNPKNKKMTLRPIVDQDGKPTDNVIWKMHKVVEACLSERNMKDVEGQIDHQRQILGSRNESKFPDNSAANLVAVSLYLNKLNTEGCVPGILTQGVHHEKAPQCRIGKWKASMQAKGKKFGTAWVVTGKSDLAAEHDMICERMLMKVYAFATVTE